MAQPIDNLKFEVILDDAKFVEAIQRDLDMASKLNSDLSKILDLKKKLNSETTQQIVNAEKVKQAEQKTAQEIAKTAVQQQKLKTEVERTAAAQRTHTGAVKETNSAILTTSQVMRSLSMVMGTAFSVYGIRRFLSSLIDITGQFEVQRMALRNMLQDIDGADKIFEDLYRFSSESTYRFSELAKYAKQMAAFNIEKSNLLETTKMLGDVASGVGVSMDRIILAYGHVKSSGFLRGIQLRSFSQNGVPILEELSKMLTEIEGKAVSLGDVFDKMMKRQIPFEMVEEAFRRMTSEGGKFYQTQEVLAKTLAGQINILKGRGENMLAAIGQSNDGLLKGAVGKLNDLVLNYDKLGAVLKEIIIIWGSYGAAVVAVTAVTQGLAAATNIGLIGALKNLMKWVAANPWGILAAAAAYLVIEVRKAEKELGEIQKITKALDDATDGYNRSLQNEIGELDALYAAIKNAHEGTEEYASAKLALQKRFDPYIQKLREEGVEVNNLTTLYNGLITKITEATKQRFLETAQKDLLTTFDNVSDAVENEVKHIINQIGNLTADQEGAIRHFVRTGEMNQMYKTIKGLDERAITVEEGGRGRNVYRDENTYQQRLSGLRQRLDRAKVVYAEEMADAAKKFDADMSSTLGNSTHKALEGWRRTVQTTLYGVDQAFEKNFMPKQDEDYFEYLERIGKHYKEVNEYKDKALEKDKHIYQQELDAIEKIDKALEGNILSDARYNKTPWRGSSGSSSNPFADNISDTKTQVSILEKFKSAYDKLAPIFGDDTNKQLAKIFGGNAKDYANLDGQIENLIGHLRTMGQEGNEAADVIETRLGTDVVSKLIKAQTELEKHQKALDKYQTTLRKWQSEDFTLGGTGFEYDINKVFSDLNTNLGKVDEKYIQAVEQAQEAHNGDARAIEEETKKLQELRDAEKDYVRAKSQESLNDLAESYLKDQYFLRGISMDNLSRLSFKQLSNLKKELKEVGEGAISMLSDISALDETLTSWGMDMQNLTEDDLKSLSEMFPGVEVQTIRLWKAVKNTGLSFDTLNEKIQSAIKKGLKNLDEEEEKSIAKLAKYAANQVLDLASSFEELADTIDDANMKEAANSISQIGQFASSVAQGFSQGGVIGAAIGGVVSLGKMIIDAFTEQEKAVQEAKEAIIAYGNALDKLAVEHQSGIFGDNQLGKVNEYVRMMQKYKVAIDDLQREVQRLASNGNDLAAVFLNEFGNGKELDVYKLEEAFNTGALKTQDEELKNAITQYKEALEGIDGVIESIFGKMASSAADKIVDSWIEAGNAALDYADILDDVAKAYSKMLIQSIIMETALDPITEDLKKAFIEGRYDDAMEMVAGAMQAIQDATPTYEQILNTFDPYFNHNNGSDSNSVGSGIKSITEDTANLLASYINAIRADVSVVRSNQEKYLPTLNDYMSKVAANTHDAARATEAILEQQGSILSELQSVIGTPGSTGSVVRVEYA